MAIYYVSASGNDADNGLGPDASHATNRPWLTVNKAADTVASGDTVYIAPGTYREAFAFAMTSAVAETKFLGDPYNAQAFKDGSGVLLTPDFVRITAYTTNDSTLPSASPTMDLAGRDFLTFENIYFVAGDTSCIAATTANSTNITFRNCVFVSSAAIATKLMDWGAMVNSSAILIERCVFLNGVNGFRSIDVFLGATGTGDVDFTIRNCLFIGSPGSEAINWDNLTNNGGGLLVEGCTFIGINTAIRTRNAGAQANPADLHSNVILSCTFGLYAAATAQQNEDYNIIEAATPRTNVTVGGNSFSNGSRSVLFNLGYCQLVGMVLRPMFEPLGGSPLLGFGSPGGMTAEDILGRLRPSGGGSISQDIGAYSRHDFAAREGTTKDASDYGMVLTGPGDQEILVAVDASATVISIKGRYDTNHAATNKPQAILLAAPEIGVTAETLTMTAAVDTWETLTFASQTPTAKGWVRIRLISRAAAGNGKSFWDTLAIA